MNFIEKIKSKKKIAECKIELLNQMSKLSKLKKKLNKLDLRFQNCLASFDEVDQITNDILDQLNDKTSYYD